MAVNVCLFLQLCHCRAVSLASQLDETSCRPLIRGSVSRLIAAAAIQG